ncbi:MAG: M20 family metallo-hydrolase [Alphaproteobacteria bacterium]|nr:M20 family metallo-hydrolase [Alphaproteobacteria bacterium]
MIAINGRRLIESLRQLSQFGKTGSGVHRLSFTSEDLAARRWLVERMQEAGLEATIDGVGNVLGRSPKPRAVLLGSHTDTVPSGGWLDGSMGVMYGVELAHAFAEAGAPGEVGIDVISFADEESTYFPTLGSRAFCGLMSAEDEAKAKSLAGEALHDALVRAGYHGRARARLDRTRHLAYLEAHIEQGPRLEAEGKRIGVVTTIVGIRRMMVVFHGQSDHAGTTPMAMRKDAGAALIAYGHRLLQAFHGLRGPDTVWNLGYVQFEPGAGNVVPKTARLLIEYRDPQTEVLDRLEAAVHAAVEETNRFGPVRAEARQAMGIPPADLSPAVGRLIEAAAAARNIARMFMPSGAGHDAMHLARFVPTGMLFIPSIGGRSHDTAENTAESDIVLGAELLAGAIEQMMAGAPLA